jgi:putative hydrolase of HD superfamily
MSLDTEVGHAPVASVGELAVALVDLGRLALAFGRIDRTAVYHPDGVTPESDTDHTVMLGWLACAVAARCFPCLDVGLVAQFALVHDAPELYAGDTPTLRITAAGRVAKAAHEHAALRRLTGEFGGRLPWFPEVIGRYEAQRLPEARFVRGLDKILPKIVHLIDGATGLVEQGMGRAELAEVFTTQRADMAGYVGEFTELMQLHTELGGQVLTHPALAGPVVHPIGCDPLDRLNSPHTAGCPVLHSPDPTPELCACGGDQR